MSDPRSGDVTREHQGGSADWRSIALSETGLVRRLNEDAVVSRPDAGIWAVADGLGGHQRGDRASALLRETLEATPPVTDLDAAAADLQVRFADAHQRLRREFGADGSGSTVAVLLAAGDRYVGMWVGDSRLWHLNGAGFELLSRDHSVVGELVAAGAIAPEDAFGHPFANRITRAVGIGGSAQLDRVDGGTAPGDRWLLSSDGLHGVVPEAEIARLAVEPDLGRAARSLIDAALAAGGPDNVSVVLIERIS